MTKKTTSTTQTGESAIAMAVKDQVFALFLIFGLCTALTIGVVIMEQKPENVGIVGRDDMDTLYFHSNEDIHKHNKSGIKLKMDEAVVTIVSTLEFSTGLYAQYDECWKCPMEMVTSINKFSNTTIKMFTQFGVSIEIRKPYNSTTNKTICQCPHIHLSERGTYHLWINRNGTDRYDCNFYTDSENYNSNTPIYVACGVFGFIWVIWVAAVQLFGKRVIKQVENNIPVTTERLVSSDLGTPTNLQAEDKRETKKKQRLKSLDAFRGISLVVMIFVNYGGGGYWFFKHSAWNGLTVADLVFPWFVFIMGTSVALSFQSQLARDTARWKLLLNTVRRTIILFVFGLAISNPGKCSSNHKGCGFGSVELSELRILGVLQRLALTYLLVALMEVFFAKRENTQEEKWWSFLGDIVPYWPEWLVCLGLLTTHICLTFLLPVPDCPRGYIGPGGIQDNSAYENCTGGAAGYIDRLLLTPAHLYPRGQFKAVYMAKKRHDPEGIMGVLTSVFLCFLGLQAGKTILIFKHWVSIVKRWIIWALITGVIAGILCKFSQNDGWIPLNKNLWSVSFVLALACMAFVALGACYLLIDVAQVWSGAPFTYPGSNPIVLYICHEVFHHVFPISWTVEGNHWSQLAMDLYGTCIWVAVAAVMNYKRIFISI